MNPYIVALLILLFYFALAWISGFLLNLHGATLWLLRGGLMLLGIVAAGLYLWFHHRLKRGKALTSKQFAGMSEQIKLLLQHAEKQLTEGKQGGLKSLPIIFVLGDLNSAKTSSVIHCGLDPEPIAGQIFGEGRKVVATDTINAWFARTLSPPSKTVFIEAGGKLAANSQLWAQVLRQTRPKRVPAAVGKGQQASRAALVCIDCEHLNSAQDSIQNLANRLKEMARSLGAPFPVYVLFTKLDRVPHFAEYVGNLTSEESAQILGATLKRMTSHGLFAEEETRRLTSEFDQIIYSLAEKRLDFLSRETLLENTGGIYEFPRELRKSRNQVVQLLVDLTRPTQLSANPFLRGFYFSGLRAVLVNEAVAVPAAARVATAHGSGATHMFNYAEAARAASQDAPQRTVKSRKMPEWSFLPHLFAGVVLADHVAFSASHQSTRVDRLRRGLVAFAALLLLSFSVLLCVSFVKNHGLETQMAQDAEHLNVISLGAIIEAPALDQLRTLDEMRDSLNQLRQFRTTGPPLSYRFGLYAGESIYPANYSLYFQNFRRLLLASTQNAMVAILNQPPSTLTGDDFQHMYFTLKAYLITTSHPQYANWNSLVPVLLDNSPAFKTPDLESQNLIHRQFTFYANALLEASPYGPEKDETAVQRARVYLRQFDALEAIYQAMLEDASKGRNPINFSRRFLQAAGYVVDNYEVPAAFTKEGYAVMQKSLQNPEKFQGEDWVLGTAPKVNLSGGALREALSTRYATDYARHWRAYLHNGRVVGYTGLKDASAKLSRLIANDSPLLQLLWLAKENTTVDIPDLKSPFDAVQRIARDSTLERLVGSGNQDYMSALSGLQGSVQMVVNTPNGPTDPGMLGQILQAASGAHVTVKGIERNFDIDAHVGPDKVDKNVGRLLEEPIDFANDAAKRAMGGGAEEVCKNVNIVTSKRPFNLRSSQQATLQEVQDLFHPQGTLWTSLQARVGTVQRQGSVWINVGSAPQSQSFLNFLNHAQQFADTLFPNGSPTIHLSYTLRAVPLVGPYKTSLVMNNHVLTDPAQEQSFVWEGGESSVSLTLMTTTQTGNLSYQGPWALFDFFGRAEWNGNNPATLDYPFEENLVFAHHPVGGGSRTSVQYVLKTNGVQVFKKEFLAGLHCSAR